MLHQLKAGDRDSAEAWFHENYNTLKQKGMLADSVIRRMMDKPATALDSLEAPKPAEALKQDLKDFIRREAHQIAATLGEKGADFLPEDFLEDVEKYVILFTENEQYRRFFQEALIRSRKYAAAFDTQFSRRGFPPEIIYFAIVESGFDPNAISKAGAAGMFQFMPGTARDYGLQVTPQNDERFSALKSAAASAEYLMDLYLELGSLNLALASYNGGAAKTRRALRQLENVSERNFWTLREKQILFEETQEYVPQIFAAIILSRGKNASRFGFTDPGVPESGTYDIFYLSQQVNLAKLAADCSLSMGDIYRYNTDIDSGGKKTPAKVADYPLLIPSPKAGCARSWLNEQLGGHLTFDGSDQAEIPQKTEAKRADAPEKKKAIRPKKRFAESSVVEKRELKAGDEIEYRVIRGNTLFMLARIFNVDADNIMEWNDLRFKSLKENQVLRIKIEKPLTHYIYRVPVKSSFSDLASQFDIPSTILKRTNDFDKGMMQAGDTLNVYIF